MAAGILRKPPDVPPGTKFVYTSTAYVMAACAIEQVAQKPWEELIRERLFAPLGITTAGFGSPPGMDGKQVPWGHGPRFYWRPFRWVRADVPRHPDSIWADVPLAGAPAGLVHMSTHDWARFVSLLLRGDPANPTRHCTLLKADTLARLNHVDPGGPPLPGGWGGSGYVSGWVESAARWASGKEGATGRVLWHQGDNSRWNSGAYLAPEIDLAVLVATNSAFKWEASSKIARALVDAVVSAQGIPGDGLAGEWQGALQSLLAETPLQLTIKPDKSALLETTSEKITLTSVGVGAQNDREVILSAAKGLKFAGTLNSDGSQLSGWLTTTRDRWWVTFRRVARP
jgi:CubicO group peptidase (beta-lactamase class C family)